MNSIKLMTDYECFPIWHYGGERVGDIDPASLPISKELAVSLLDWASTYDETLNRQDPIKSGFPTEAAETEFIEKGLELAQMLKCELKSTEVYYYHDGVGQDVRI